MSAINLQVVRALEFLQKGRDFSCNKWEAVSIPRGTLQVSCSHCSLEIIKETFSDIKKKSDK